MTDTDTDTNTNLIKILHNFKEEITRGQLDILHEVRLSKTEIERVVSDALPKDHDEQHVTIKRFLDHSPDPKIHGDHHDFTEGVRSKIEYTIVAMFKGLGGIILLALAIGLYSWAKHMVGVNQ